MVTGNAVAPPSQDLVATPLVLVAEAAVKAIVSSASLLVVGGVII
jgi:hypothetical protein